MVMGKRQRSSGDSTDSSQLIATPNRIQQHGLGSYSTGKPTHVTPTGQHHAQFTYLVQRLAWRLNEIADSLGLSRRTLERLRAGGRFPPPDLIVHRTPLWRADTIQAWLEDGGQV
jgi:predicted DNA-binding transcriptional regulator AlpA